MSEVIGVTACPMSGCNSVAEFKKDKREKLYINCPTCGRLPGSTNESQKIFQKIQDDGKVYASIEDMQAAMGAPEISEQVQEVESEQESEQVQENSESTSGAGVFGLLVFAILGGGSWLISQKNKRA